MERWVLRLQPYNYKAKYVPSNQNIADALSRLTKVSAVNEGTRDDDYVRQVTLGAVPVALRVQDIQEESSKDPELTVVRECIRSSNWETLPKEYKCVRNELTTIGFVVLRGTRIVIPRELQSRVVDLAHEGHQGVMKTKERLRSKVWWPGMDCDAERKCKRCIGCQMVTKSDNPPPVKSTKIPDKPWQELAMDLLGPLPKGESLLVLIDYFSRWIEVDIVYSTTTRVIVSCMDNHFARRG